MTPMGDAGIRGGVAALRWAQLLLVVAAGALWAAARLPWVVIHSADGLGQPRQIALSGAQWSTALVPLAVLCLAAAVAALAVRGWSLRIVAVLVAMVSLADGYLAISMWVIRDIAVRALDIAEVPLTSLVGTERHRTGAVLCMLAAMCALGAAALLMRAAVRATGGSVKYLTPAARRETAGTVNAATGGPQLSERMMWEAFDEGCDPTGDAPDAAADPDPEGR